MVYNCFFTVFAIVLMNSFLTFNGRWELKLVEVFCLTSN